MKVLGNKKERNPLECIEALSKLNLDLKKLRPDSKKKGIILKFKTWKELEEFNLKRSVEYVESKR